MELNDNQIQQVFKSKGCWISKVNEKGDRDYGMTFTLNRQNQVHKFGSFTQAYNSFKKMNWL